MLIICIVFIVFKYDSNKGKVFKDEYMKDIFVDEEIQGEVEEAISEVVVNKDEVLEKETLTVEIKGEVKKPDVYILNKGSIIKDLIEASGGLTENSDISKINRADELQNHQLIVIPNINDKDKEVEVVQGGDNNNVESNSSKTSNKVNINTADLNELKTINGIGDSKAQSIITHREKNGKFKTIDDIKNVTWIGEKIFENIKDKIDI
ncbi:helix-hairpin-helix domain-containing protein [Clostridium chauvoei]|uniref:helix-hairpin-helix domain-containing protein n=1 Tax=Clostridium chauvoei TaxID=46867 RepID=UPI0021A366EF|nr:helix-hairpin-helix domain-containing protein [Clostridium chauvoei]